MVGAPSSGSVALTVAVRVVSVVGAVWSIETELMTGGTLTPSATRRICGALVYDAPVAAAPPSLRVVAACRCYWIGGALIAAACIGAVIWAACTMAGAQGQVELRETP